MSDEAIRRRFSARIEPVIQARAKILARNPYAESELEHAQLVLRRGIDDAVASQAVWVGVPVAFVAATVLTYIGQTSDLGDFGELLSLLAMGCVIACGWVAGKIAARVKRDELYQALGPYLIPHR